MDQKGGMTKHENNEHSQPNDERSTNPQEERGVVSDRLTLRSIRSFLATEKPTSIGPVDVLHVITLMVRKAQDHPVFDSQLTLARSFGCELKTIARSQKKLASPKIDWIARPQRRGKTRALSLKFQNLPGEEPVRRVLSREAGQLAVRYRIGLQKYLRRKKFPKQWLKQQEPSAQRILNECGGDLELACAMVGHALAHPKHKRKAGMSLYNLLSQWKKVKQTYSQKLQEQENERQRSEAQEAANTEAPPEQGELA